MADWRVCFICSFLDDMVWLYVMSSNLPSLDFFSEFLILKLVHMLRVSQTPGIFHRNSAYFCEGECVVSLRKTLCVKTISNSQGQLHSYHCIQTGFHS